MEKIEVFDEFNFSPEEVWKLLTDHERYAEYANLQESSILKKGDTEKNGFGAVRKIHTGKIEFIEEVKVFDKPVRFDYLIIECTIPIKHIGGTILLEKTDFGTRLNWTSQFEMPEGTSPAIGRGARASSAKMFKEILSGIKNLLEGRNNPV